MITIRAAGSSISDSAKMIICLIHGLLVFFHFRTFLSSNGRHNRNPSRGGSGCAACWMARVSIWMPHEISISAPRIRRIVNVLSVGCVFRVWRFSGKLCWMHVCNGGTKWNFLSRIGKTVVLSGCAYFNPKFISKAMHFGRWSYWYNVFVYWIGWFSGRSLSVPWS
jgi:hypothetical protein